MKRVGKITIAVLISVFFVATVLGGCDTLFPKRETEAPRFYEQKIKTGTDYIIIEDIYFPYEGQEVVYCLNDGEWQESGEFYGLIPGSEYTIRAKTLENEDYYESPVAEIKVTLPKREQENIPSVIYEQANKQITLKGVTEDMEVSWDNGETWGGETEKTIEQNGLYEVQVRYKETSTDLSGEIQALSFQISNFYGGFGTKELPYLITTYEQLTAIGAGSYKLLNDIEFPVEAVSVIKGNEKARIDGNGKRLISPKIEYKGVTSAGGSHYQGIFMFALSVENLVIENPEIVITDNYSTGWNLRVGILAGKAEIVKNCDIINGKISFVDNEVTNVFCGGLVGSLSEFYADASYIEDCRVDADISMSQTENLLILSIYLGGVVGSQEATSGESYAIKRVAADVNIDVSADIKTISNMVAGGLAGTLNSGIIIEDCSTTGSIVFDLEEVSPTCGVSLGGISGRLYGTVSRCVSDMNIDITTNKINEGDVEMMVGGLIGRSGDVSVSNSLYMGFIKVGLNIVNADIDFYCDAISAKTSESAVFNNCWHGESADGFGHVHSQLASQDKAYSDLWQRDVLGLDDSVWALEYGYLPRLR